MSLAGTTLLNGLATAVRLVGGLVVNKLLAVHVGTSGFAVVGQFQSLMAVIGAGSGAVYAAGVTKLTAEHHCDPERQWATWRTAIFMGLIGAGVCATLLVVTAAGVAQHLLGDAALRPALWWLAGAAGLMTFNAVLLAALSGQGRIGTFVAANIGGTLLGVAVCVWLLPRHGLLGGLVALTISQAMSAICAMVGFARLQPGSWQRLVGRVDGELAHALGRFALMAAVTALSVPASMLAIREGMVRAGGLELAGQWQAMWKLSETHLLFLTTTLSLHFLPRFSRITCGDKLALEVGRAYRFVLPLVACTALVIWTLREPLTLWLFTPEFLPLTAALGVQLCGDVLKIGSWVPAYTMISHARTRLYVISEIAFSVLVTLACILGAYWQDLIGAAAGYAVTYLAYWSFVHRQLGSLTRTLGRHSEPER